jgi:tetratricopeptide (TPR) repeat protein
MLTIIDGPLPGFLQNPWSWIIIAGFIFLLMVFVRGQVTIFKLVFEVLPQMRVASGIVSGVLFLIGISGLVGWLNPRPPATPKSLYQSGKEALTSGARGTAVKNFALARAKLALDPCQDGQTQEWWSDLYFQSSSLETSDKSVAKQYALSSLCLDPDNQDAQRALKRLDDGNLQAAAREVLALGDVLEKNGNQDRADKLYLLVTEISHEAQGYLEVGQRFNKEGEFDQAAQQLSRGDEESKDNSYNLTRAYINKEWGVALFNLHQCHNAETKFQEAAELFNKLNKSDQMVTDGLLMAKHPC